EVLEVVVVVPGDEAADEAGLVGVRLVRREHDQQATLVRPSGARRTLGDDEPRLVPKYGREVRERRRPSAPGSARDRDGSGRPRIEESADLLLQEHGFGVS